MRQPHKNLIVEIEALSCALTDVVRSHETIRFGIIELRISEKSAVAFFIVIVFAVGNRTCGVFNL